MIHLTNRIFCLYEPGETVAVLEDRFVEVEVLRTVTWSLSLPVSFSRARTLAHFIVMRGCLCMRHTASDLISHNLTHPPGYCKDWVDIIFIKMKKSPRERNISG